MSGLGALVTALGQGVVYALIAVAVGLVFGVLRQVNIAQGEIIAAGAYSLWMTRALPLVARVLVCIGVCIAMSIAMQLVVFRPLRGASALTTLVVTFGLSYGMEAVWLLVFGANGQPVAAFSGLNRTLVGGRVDLRWVTIVAIVVGGVLFSVLLAILYRTNLGMKMRALAEDYRTARLIGVRIGRVTTWAFVFGGVASAVVAILVTVQNPLVTPSFGLNLVIVALVGVVLGGIDSLGRGTAGGFIIGFVNSILGSVLPAGQIVFLPTLTFLFVAVVLVARPSGLLAARGTGVERV
ncbi:MAG: branched-chain amino acid ABC transporter permease [Acidimicrobiales bacterium]